MATLNHHIRAIVIALVIVFLSFAVPSHAEKVTFVKEYTYQASELDSKASCRTISLEMVKRLLLEELGTYLISETEVKDFKLTKEQVKTYSAGIVGAEIIEDKWDGKTYWLKARVSADPKEVSKALKKIMDDPFKGKELEETRKKAEELTKEVERLNKELAKATNKQPSKKIQQEYKTAIQGLSAVEWLDKGNESAMKGRYERAIEAYSKAIELKPDYVEAYSERGLAYDNIGNHQQAINDLTKAIKLEPDAANVYLVRGFAYGKLANYQQAIKDFTKVIELEPDYTLAYNNRGFAYSKLGNYQQAIKDYNRAIKLEPDEAYHYNDRGIVYKNLGNYQQAIKDFYKAIELKPEYAEAYYSRGLVYGKLGNYQHKIKDLQIAARLGFKTAQDALLKMGEKW
ncbi:MAG: tetratricopeptide repeat protein [Thermodesulfovibrionales bacterium]